MCIQCYKDYGEPRIDNPLVRELEAAIREVYEQEGGGAGGRLHVILDDWNIEDEQVHGDFYDKWITEDDRDEAVREVHRRCLRLLRKATEKERASALARYDGYTRDTPVTDT